MKAEKEIKDWESKLNRKAKTAYDMNKRLEETNIRAILICAKCRQALWEDLPELEYNGQVCKAVAIVCPNCKNTYFYLGTINFKKGVGV